MTTPTVPSFEALDRKLEASDADSLAWTDGLDWQSAQLLLNRLPDVEWQLLLASWHARPKNWRECLATILDPRDGLRVADLLLDMSCDGDFDVAFRALLAIAFHCGVSASADSPAFLDDRYQLLWFVARARGRAGLRSRVIAAEAQCSEFFAVSFRLLAEVLADTQP